MSLLFYIVVWSNLFGITEVCMCAIRKLLLWRLYGAMMSDRDDTGTVVSGIDFLQRNLLSA